MKVKVVVNENIEENIVTIECKEYDETIVKLTEMIESVGINIVGKINNERYMINLTDIFYFEAVDNRVFAYTLEDVYEVTYKIQELVDQFANTDFLQVSRTVVLNIDKIDRVSSMINGKILAILSNGEKQIISRAYANNFKDKLRRKKDD